MNAGAMIWLIIFAVSATVFFLIAAVVTFKGVSDLRDLLRHSQQVVKSARIPRDKDP